MLTVQQPGRMQHAVARAPLRISLGGGGTDVPWYANEFGGSALVVTLAAGTTVLLRRRAEVGGGGSLSDPPGNSDDIYTARALNGLQEGASNEYEVVSLGDVPIGTGLGSSGAYLVGLTAAWYRLNMGETPPQKVALVASELETRLSRGEAGAQDTWSSALGGLNRLDFNADGTVSAQRVDDESSGLSWLNRHLVLAYTGLSRSASLELRTQRQRSRESRVEELDAIKTLGYEAEEALSQHDLARFARCVTRHDAIKRRRSPVPQRAQQLVEAGVAGGALASKVVGAGGGGFVLFVCPEDKVKPLRQMLAGRQTPALESVCSSLGVKVNVWTPNAQA